MAFLSTMRDPSFLILAIFIILNKISPQLAIRPLLSVLGLYISFKLAIFGQHDIDSLVITRCQSAALIFEQIVVGLVEVGEYVVVSGQILLLINTYLFLFSSFCVILLVLLFILACVF